MNHQIRAVKDEIKKVWIFTCTKCEWKIVRVSYVIGAVEAQNHIETEKEREE